MPTILWSNGTQQSAPTWEALLEEVRLAQPRKMDEKQLRRALDRRARLWSGMKLDQGAPAREFFRDMEAAKMVLIVTEAAS